jgi:hypothetical protein
MYKFQGKSKIVFYDNKTCYWESDKIYICSYKYIDMISNPNYLITHIQVDSLKIDIVIMYEKKDGIEEFVRGYLYKEDKEYEIYFYARYVSLQIGKYGYDDVGICKVDECDIF